MGRKNVSLKMIADELGISVNSVSHALRDFDDISEATKAKVRQKALELGYMPNKVSQRAKDGENTVVAILIETFDNLYFNCLFKPLVTEFTSHKEYDCQIIYLNGSYMDVVKQCVLQRVDVLLSHSELPADVYEFAKLQNIHVIRISDDGKSKPADIVSIDDDMGCQLAARYLWGIHSGEKYAYASEVCSFSEYRYQKYVAELNKLGVTDIVRFDYGVDNILKMYDFILNGYTNIFCYNDDIAYKMIRDLDKISYDIRKTFPNLHIIGFDGLCEQVAGLRQLTTIKIDYVALAHALYQMVDFRLNNPKAPFRKTVVPVSLYQRRKKE